MKRKDDQEDGSNSSHMAGYIVGLHYQQHKHLSQLRVSRLVACALEESA